MADFPATIDLGSLDGSDGFAVSGATGGDWAGASVSSAGDVNGDGYDDFIIGAPGADPNGGYSGSAYLVFGGPGGFPANLALSGLDGVSGFRIQGAAAGDYSGVSVSSAGDVNGDGYDDLIVGAYRADANGTDSGAAYIIFGKASGFAASLNVSTLSGSNGFRVTGGAAFDQTGFSVSSAGDVNGDGYDDVIIGARYAAPNGTRSGASYVMFGKASGFTADFAVSALTGANGFKISGATAGIRAGWSVSSAGDINGDGFDDLIIGARNATGDAPSAGGAYVVFGKASGFTANLWTTDLNGTNGFALLGVTANDWTGFSVHSAGDVNGDGYDDVIVGTFSAAPNGYASGASYVVFGKAGGFSASIDLAALDGTDGFRISGAAAGDRTGSAVSGAGDINGDGYDDLIVGGYSSASNGSHAGISYVLLGQASGFTADLNVSTLSGSDGFALTGAAAGDASGFSVSGAGDLNGDGYDDLLIGAKFADPNGASSGAAYVVYGHATAPAPVIWTGGVGDEAKDGGAAADTLSGGDGKDVLSGLAGDDQLNGDAGNDTLYGGGDSDTLHGGIGNDIVNGDDGDDQVYGDEGNDKVNGGAGADYLYGGAGADLMTGGEGDDVLDGGDGNDTLDGGVGADSMTGGLGNDVYYVDDAGDQTIEASGEGTDIVRASISWTLADNIEVLELQGAADIDGTGNGLANRLTGNAGSNHLDGGAGADTINGGDGDDYIIGGTGNDLMRGGAGADLFIIGQSSVMSSRAGGGTLETDFIFDFSTAEGDRLDLSAIDANTAVAGDDAFDRITIGTVFTKYAGEILLTYSASADQTVIKLDVDGDGRADYQIKINGDVTGDAGGWIL